MRRLLKEDLIIILSFEGLHVVLIHAHKSCLLALYLSACFLGWALLCNVCMKILQAEPKNLDVFCLAWYATKYCMYKACSQAELYYRYEERYIYCIP
jgi:hypothetical protein